MISEKIKKSVLEILLIIPKDKITTYKNIANALKIHPRIVGMVLKQNRNYKYPCYKVVHSNANIGQYNRGKAMKIDLLEKIGCIIKNDRIINFEEKFFDVAKYINKNKKI